MSYLNRIAFANLSALLCGLVLCTTSMADPVWHCSRSYVQVADASDNFQLASLDAEREVVRLSLRDVYTIYQGSPVKVSGLPLSACFNGGKDLLTNLAMRSLGADSAVVQTLSRQSSITTNRLYMVHDEKAMLACITQHHPAIGYLAKPTHTEAVGPCF